jgi:hypothetical protein
MTALPSPFLPILFLPCSKPSADLSSHCLALVSDTMGFAFSPRIIEQGFRMMVYIWWINELWVSNTLGFD